MNVQTERIENHRARLTVEIEPKTWDSAKKDAAKELSKEYRIKGFRKGKAPYKIVVRHLGEGAIIEQAMQTLGNTVYPEALDQAEIKPYTSGSIEDFKLEPQPTYIFTVPLQPEVTLGDYHDVRLDFEKSEITDEEVENALRNIQQREAVVEDSANPVQSGDRITVDIHSEFADGEERPEDEDDVEEDTIYKGDNFLHRHDAVLNLDPENEPVIVGFIEAMVGTEKDEEREFELTVPEDNDDYKDIAGRKISFGVTVKEIQNVTLPELNDDLAARVTEEEEETLTLLQLRVRVRENLQTELERNSKNEYADKVLDEIVEDTEVSYPDAMLDERIHDMIQNLDNQLQQQGMNLETYQQVTGITHEDLHEQYHDDAVKSLKRSLVLGEIIDKEELTVDPADIEAQIDEVLSQFGEQAASLRQFFDTPQQRDSIANSLLYDKVMDRLAKIGQGLSLEDEEEAEDVIADEPVAEIVEEANTEDATDEEVVETETEEVVAPEVASDESETEEETD